MKKKTYRARKINSMDSERLAELTDGKDIVVGIDVAKHVQFAAFSVGNKEVVETVRFRHPEQTSEFLDLLDSLKGSSLQIALEPTGSYGDVLRYQLQTRGYAVYRVNAKRVHDACEVYDGVPSAHDAKCAAIVAWLHSDGASELWPAASETKRVLTVALAQMQEQDDRYHRGLNHLEAALARHWPEVTAIVDLDSLTLITLLSTYGGPATVARRRAEAIRLMNKTSRRALATEKIDAIARSATETLGVTQLEAEREFLRDLSGLILEARKQAALCRKRVEALTEEFVDVQAMGRVIGKASAAVLVCKVGSPQSFPNARAYEKSAGLNLREKSSGKHQGRLALTKRGSGQARQYLFLAVLRLIQSDSVMKAWYHKKVARDSGQNPVKLKAVVALMRKLIRALWHVGQGQEFDSRRLFDTSRLVITEN
jgi:transposase